MSGGIVTDYKKGPTDPVDPTAQVGTYSINTVGGTITFNYGAGGTFTYGVVDPTSTTYPNPGTYTFAGTGGATTLTITVSAGHC